LHRCHSTANFKPSKVQLSSAVTFDHLSCPQCFDTISLVSERELSGEVLAWLSDCKWFA